ncbi:hybrid-cluster NAD(P)-dependent oxidoreductase [Trinickia terrae]|uniref:Hybrid-cluster NAD(P)-dependent oxidoreductase n=1 Tax=Trinickia terrae TaxID=2571161 RepID=A0A4V5PG43_9BURK|nr:hybrid-cluster NAD(P)-dependent oxidoreductase [Trinickia terrae]TKC78110.1 hybrid-cluster NAD(P)-dependent oxidoreductase [Trinickia terrae]
MTSAASLCIVEPVQAEADRFTSAGTWERAGAAWTSEQKKRLICCRVFAETHDVRTFVFSTEEGLPISFEPGQFITVSAEIKGQPVTRCYTISSPPTRPYTLSITVKRVPGGAMSNWLHDSLKPGGVLQAHGPSGVFTPTSHPAAKSLYLSAGSGVTPLMSMTRASIDLGLDRDIVFVHSSRTPEDIIFRDELRRLAAESSRLEVIHVCEAVGNEPDWKGPVGRLSLELLLQRVPDFKEREVFTCGPAGYMNAAKDILRRGGHDPSRYHQESFDIGAAEVERDARQAAATSNPVAAERRQTYTVRLARSSSTFTIDDSQTVLAAAKQAGVAVASSCSQGICGTCKTRLIEGTVDMRHNGGIRQREIDKGMRLLCCSRATSDLVLDL